MFDKIINLIKEALRQMVAYKSISEAIEINDTVLTEKMTKKFKLWQGMYKDEPEWQTSVIRSLGIPKMACEVAAMTMLNEFSIKAMPKDYKPENNEEIDAASFSGKLNDLLNKHFTPKLTEKIEKALAMGGCVIKPYLSNGEINFDFVMQGDFYPIAFDDDGNIIDIAFVDRIVSGDYMLTRVERQTFANNSVVIENKAYKAKLEYTKEEKHELGLPIPLTEVSRWKDIEPVVEIENVDKPLFGYFKVASANNVDLDSPMGVSFFNSATHICKKIDEQFARLDWEYEGGQMAIDVDPTAMQHTRDIVASIFKRERTLPVGKDRIFRYVDLGEDDTYKAWTPNLRDDRYLNGFKTYLMQAEDKMGLARGSLGATETEFAARTATEILILKQRTYDTVHKNQNALEHCFRDVIDALDVFVELYQDELGVDFEKHNLVINWGDSILTNREAEIEFKLKLLDEGVLSKAEVRSWYTGEPINIAEEMVQSIFEKEQENSTRALLGQIDMDENGTDNE